MTLLSVVIPTFNRAATLPLAVRSVLGQQDVDVEVVVVDDHSTDGAIERLEDARVRVLRTPAPRSGPAVGRTIGAAAASGTHIAFLDDDDIWGPTKAASQLAAMAESGARWSCSSAVTIDADGRIIGSQRWARSGDVHRDVAGVDVVPGGGSSVIAHRSLVEEVGPFDDSLETQHDWDYWIRLAARSPLAAVDRPLMAYRVWSGGMSRDISRMDRAYAAIVAKHDPDSLGTPRRRECDRLFHQYLARMELRERHRAGAARRHLRLARTTGDPKQVLHAVAAVVAPGATERWRARQELLETPAEWIEEARPWLAGLDLRVMAVQV